MIFLLNLIFSLTQYFETGSFDRNDMHTFLMNINKKFFFNVTFEMGLKILNKKDFIQYSSYSEDTTECVKFTYTEEDEKIFNYLVNNINWFIFNKIEKNSYVILINQ